MRPVDFAAYYNCIIAHHFGKQVLESLQIKNRRIYKIPKGIGWYQRKLQYWPWHQLGKLKQTNLKICCAAFITEYPTIID